MGIDTLELAIGEVNFLERGIFHRERRGLGSPGGRIFVV